MSRSSFFRSSIPTTRISRRSFAIGVTAATTIAAHANVARAEDEVQTTPEPFAIPVHVSPALKSQGILGDRWACSVSAALADELGYGAQLRVYRNSSNYAVFTVTEIRDDDAVDEIRISKAGRQRLGTSASGFSATLRPALATQQLSESAAKSASEFIERVADDGEHQGLLVMAPHGGSIEINTDRQARRIAQNLAGADVSSWCCNGYKQGGGAFERWHVTSTLISPASFPGLASVTQRDYAYGVSVHGMQAAGVLIGGAAPAELKQLLRQEIKAALGNAAGPVEIAKSGQALAGASPDNVTNWVTAGGDGGVQIEQSSKVRTKYWQDVADAVSSVFAGLL